MKKLVLVFFVFFNVCFIYSFERSIYHSYNADYSLFPDFDDSEKLKNQLGSRYEVNYCVQSNLTIPKSDLQGNTCDQILTKLDQMGGLDKEAFGVSYLDANGDRKALFKKSFYSNDGKELYIKDKTAGGMNMDLIIEKYKNNGNVYIVNGILNKKPDNFFVRGLKKGESEVFVLMQENDESINVYALIQCSYSPIEHKFLKSFVETAVTARVLEIQNWFYRMLSGKFE